MTIQGLYKLVKKMIEQRVLVKEGHFISIDAAWIHNLINFTETLKRTYLASEVVMSNILLKEGETKTFTFEKVIDMDNFWWHILATLMHYYSSQEHPDKNVYNYNDHSWFQLVRTESEQALAEAFEESGMRWYLVSGSQSFLDTLVGNMIEMKGFHYCQVLPRKVFGPNQYIEVIGDFIIETSLPKFIHELMERLYSRVSSIREFNAQDISMLLRQPGRTALTLSRDRKQALRLRKKIKGVFEAKYW